MTQNTWVFTWKETSMGLMIRKEMEGYTHTSGIWDQGEGGRLATNYYTPLHCEKGD